MPTDPHHRNGASRWSVETLLGVSLLAGCVASRMKAGKLAIIFTAGALAWKMLAKAPLKNPSTVPSEPSSSEAPEMPNGGLLREDDVLDQFLSPAVIEEASVPVEPMQALSPATEAFNPAPVHFEIEPPSPPPPVVKPDTLSIAAMLQQLSNKPVEAKESPPSKPLETLTPPTTEIPVFKGFVHQEIPSPTALFPQEERPRTTPFNLVEETPCISAARQEFPALPECSPAKNAAWLLGLEPIPVIHHDPEWEGNASPISAAAHSQTQALGAEIPDIVEIEQAPLPVQEATEATRPSTSGLLTKIFSDTTPITGSLVKASANPVEPEQPVPDEVDPTAAAVEQLRAKLARMSQNRAQRPASWLAAELAAKAEEAAQPTIVPIADVPLNAVRPQPNAARRIVPLAPATAGGDKKAWLNWWK